MRAKLARIAAMAMIGTACSGPNTITSTGIRMIEEPKPTMPPTVPATSPKLRIKTYSIYGLDCAMPAFGRAIRSRFFLEPGTAFLNHGSFGTAPRAVLAAAERWRLRMEASPDRFLREVKPAALRSALATLGRFLNV